MGFPQFCFGGDGQGNYGLWFVADYFPVVDGVASIVPVVGFIPVYGLGSYGTGTVQFLYSLPDTQLLPDIAASEDGRVWACSYISTHLYYLPSGVRFKSPGPLDSNYAEPWQMTISNQSWSSTYIGYFTSHPVYGYFNGSRIIIFDESGRCLDALFCNTAPDTSQDMRLYFLISNNGQTWSRPFYISDSNFANRGYQSMALDIKTGNLIFGWYDGRDDPTEKSVQYFGAVLCAKQLDKMVEQIPLSNPLFNLGPATTPLPPNEGR